MGEDLSCRFFFCFLKVATVHQRREDTALVEEDNNSDNYSDIGWMKDDDNLHFPTAFNLMTTKIQKIDITAK